MGRNVAISRFPAHAAPVITLPSTTMGPDVWPRASVLVSIAARPCGRRVRLQTVRRGVENNVLVNRQRFGPGRSGYIRRDFSFVFPQQISAGGVERLDDGSRSHNIHDSPVNEGNGFRLPRSYASCPHHPELPDVLFMDLFEWTESLRVVCPAEHQPVFRPRILQHLLGDWHIILNLCRRT
jgi:hypothetical protein